jgi:plasmid stability protein
MPNLTVKIDDEELVRRAKVYAAQRKTSLSSLVREYLESLVASQDSYEMARERAMKWMSEGIPMGGTPLSRERTHDR